MGFVQLEVALGRFYFHLSGGNEITLDEEGTELPDLSAAKGEAVLAARELLADAIKSGDPDVPEILVIADGTGRPLANIPLTTVLPKSLKNRAPVSPRDGESGLPNCAPGLPNLTLWRTWQSA